MRTYSNFLLFEEVLDFAPTTHPVLYPFLQDVTRPKTSIVAEDCFTKVGKNVDISFEIEGLIELATDLSITQTRLDALLAQGVYTVAVRNLNACTSPTGVCRKCYAGTYIDQVAPAVGTFLRLEPEYNYQTDVLLGNGGVTTYTLSQAPTDYTKVLVIIQGAIQMSGFTISDTTLTMSSPAPLGTHIVVKYFKITAQPFVGFLAQTYSGSLLGMKPLVTQTINIRPSLAQNIFTEEQLRVAVEALRIGYPTITEPYITYLDSIKDRLEKAVYIAMLYGLYSNVDI